LGNTALVWGLEEFTGEKMCKAKGRTPMDLKDYNSSFGIEDGHIDKAKLKEALNRAWETRNFEIDKFWVRVAYFWGFIALIFGGYIAVITEKNDNVIEMHLDLYLILLGLIFSVAWLLVIRGSKCWQRNWEEHINKLENSITGPLYKTIYCTKESYYSVSGINKILAYAVIGVWGVLFLECIIRKKEVFTGIFRIVRNFTKDWLVPVSIVAAVVCIIFLVTKGQSDNGNFKIERGNNKKEGFVYIGKKI
jgi:hypothetical protein